MSKTLKSITLEGSADIVTEFFDYGINSILYQRGIYPAEFFTRQEKYGLAILRFKDNELKTYLSNILQQLHYWLLRKEVHRLVVVIAEIQTKKTMERWEFKMQCEGELDANGKAKTKEVEKIQEEIRAIIRQITASVAFLPLLENPCSFDVLLYTNEDTLVPIEWAESTAHLIPGCEEVQLRNFSTAVHKVDTAVQYRTCE